jgi:hypothetical protein
VAVPEAPIDEDELAASSKNKIAALSFHRHAVNIDSVKHCTWVTEKPERKTVAMARSAVHSELREYSSLLETFKGGSGGRYRGISSNEWTSASSSFVYPFR